MNATLSELVENMIKIMHIIRDCEMIWESDSNDYVKLEEQKRAYKRIRDVVFGEGAENEHI